LVLGFLSFKQDTALRLGRLVCLSRRKSCVSIRKKRKENKQGKKTKEIAGLRKEGARTKYIYNVERNIKTKEKGFEKEEKKI
jgi:hypothetical protein